MFCSLLLAQNVHDYYCSTCSWGDPVQLGEEETESMIVYQSHCTYAATEILQRAHGRKLNFIRLKFHFDHNHQYSQFLSEVFSYSHKVVTKKLSLVLPHVGQHIADILNHNVFSNKLAADVIFIDVAMISDRLKHSDYRYVFSYLNYSIISSILYSLVY